MATREAPTHITAPCPTCAESTFHQVLRGTLGTRGEVVTLDATVKCEECGTTHHVVTREAKDVEVSVVVSEGQSSRRTKVSVPGDADLATGEALIVDGLNCLITGIESKDMKRVDAGNVKDIQTIWMKQFEEIPVGFAINLDHKTITKVIPAKPDHEFTVGEEFLFGRLRVTIHAIKTEERLLKRGSAEASEIKRVFAKPTNLGDFTPRPDKHTREQLRVKEERREMRDRSR